MADSFTPAEVDSEDPGIGVPDIPGELPEPEPDPMPENPPGEPGAVT